MLVLVKQVTQRETKTSGQQLALPRVAASQVLQTFLAGPQRAVSAVQLNDRLAL